MVTDMIAASGREASLFNEGKSSFFFRARRTILSLCFLDFYSLNIILTLWLGMFYPDYVPFFPAEDLACTNG
jgi:hypothetical protein